MAGPPPAIGPVVFQAIRATAYDLPEDFVSRLEPGLDAPTKRSLESGVRVLRRLRAVWRWTWTGFVVGVLSLVFGGFIWSQFPLFAVILAGTGASAWALSVVTFVYLVALSLRHYGDIHRVEAFARALHGSSLARDIG